MKDSKIYFYKDGWNGSIKRSKNQKVIQIHRANGGITFELNYNAMKNLSANAYLLYMYLIMHPEKKVWVLSSKHVFSTTALTKNTYPSAVNELIEKRYLVKGVIEYDSKTWDEDAYHMYEAPLPENQVTKWLLTWKSGKVLTWKSGNNNKYNNNKQPRCLRNYNKYLIFFAESSKN